MEYPGSSFMGVADNLHYEVVLCNCKIKRSRALEPWLLFYSENTKYKYSERQDTATTWKELSL